MQKMKESIANKDNIILNLNKEIGVIKLSFESHIAQL